MSEDFDALACLDWASRSPGKAKEYADDVYFREAAEDLLATLPPGAAEPFCGRHALLVLKPDAVVTGRLTDALEWLAGNEFRIAASAAIRFDRHTIRALWQDSLVDASRDRVDLADEYMTATDCLLLVVRHDDLSATASEILRVRKGSPHPHDCRPGQLRYQLGSMNFQLNLVHAADDPADLVRELGVLCDHRTRCGLVLTAVSGTEGLAAARELVRVLEASHAREDLSFDRLLDRLASRSPAGGALARAVGDIAAGRSRDWRGLLRLLGDGAVPITRWERIVLGTTLLEPYRSGRA